jgi:tetratricopeptide (TPR) repeat protein
MQGNVHEIDVDDSYASYEEIDEVVEDAEVVEEDGGGYVPEQADAYGYAEHETGDANEGYAPTQARGGFGRAGGGFGQPNELDAPEAEYGQNEAAYIESGPDYETADRDDPNAGGYDANAGGYGANAGGYGANAGGYGANAGGYDDELPPESGQDTTELINKTLEDAAAFRRVRLYAKALDVLRQGLEIEPRSMDLHEVYRDVLIESEQTEEAVEEMLVIASLYVDALDGESAARALQDVLAFDPQNQRAIDMLQELGYEIVDENENVEGQELEAGDPYGEVEPAQHERLPSYDLEEMGAADVASHYEDQRQVHVRGAQAPDAYGEPEGLLGGDELPSFPLDDAEQVESYEDEDAGQPPPMRPLPGGGAERRRPSVQPESAAELRASAQQQPPPVQSFGHISMVPRTSKPPTAGVSGGSTIELEDALDEAEFFCSRGLYDDARAILTEQLSKHPNHVLLNERLAEIDAQDGQRGSGAREKPQQDLAMAADDAFDLAHGLDALEDYANIEPAEGHANEEQQVDVEEVFAKFKEGVAKQISVDDYGAHYDLGIAYKEMHLLDDAIREFDVAAGDPDRECVCRSMIGMIEIERGRVNEAIESFLQGLNARIKEPQQETVLCYEIGAAYEARKMNKDALSYFQKAMRRDPNYRDVQERVRRLAKAEPPKPARQAAVGADDEFDRAFDEILGSGKIP